jgi:hypothetical protein
MKVNKLGPPQQCDCCARWVQLGVDMHWYNYGSDFRHCCPERQAVA